MDKKIRAAAENDIHNYDEKSWGDMEVMLDKHLPQKKRRRGIIVFVLLAAMSLSGWLLIHSISSSNKTDKAVTSETKEEATTAGTTTTQKSNTNNNTTTTAPVTSTEETVSNATAPTADQLNKKETLKENLVVTENNDVVNNKRSVVKRPISKSTNRLNKNKTATEPIDNSFQKDIAANAPTTNQNNAPAIANSNNSTTINSNTTKQTIAQENKLVKIESPIAEIPKDTKKKSKSFASKLYLFASGGPDLSSVGFKHSGQVKGQIGAGLGYDITDNWGVRAGFFAGRKIYRADSADYKGAYSNPSYLLEKIDANCYVFEIPVNFIYTFNPNKKHSWFASAGLSSYIMKEEKYNLTYKASWAGTQYNHAVEYRNENSHIFSILGISGGYKYNASKRFSLLAEPYMKLPLSGVGQGKVKLYNAGVMVTAAFKPFGK